MNKLTIIGNLTKDPELRTTQAGVSVCGFTVAVNRPKTAKDQNPGADFFNVSVWRGLGETCAKYLSKGRKVCVIGRVTVRTWEKDGKHGASLEVACDDIEFLGGGTAAQDAQPAESQQPPKVDEQSGFQAVETDELPF